MDICRNITNRQFEIHRFNICPQVTCPLISPTAITPTLPYPELEGLNSTLTPLRKLSEPTCLLGSIEY